MKRSFLKSHLAASILAAIFLTMAASALAAQAPKLTFKMTAEKEVKVIKDGKETVELKPVKTTNPGDTILYTLTYTNVGDADAINAVISDPVPGGMAYIAGSAKGANADVDFSIDGGKTFYKKPKQVIAGKEKVAAPDTYTNIRWTIKKVAPKESGEVKFMAKVK
ncbi:MAG: hypothetical protein WA666_09885 [Nitrospirota bacterium]